MLSSMLTEGTTPADAANERQAAAWVRGMFGQIVPRYDLLNHLLSMNIDRYWRARTVDRVSHVLRTPGAKVLDVCCGTGDLMLALQQRGPDAYVYGSDFCHPMLVAARRKTDHRRSNSPLFEADALELPLTDASLDLITVAFGFRNLANYQQRPGGAAANPKARRPAGDSRIFYSAQRSARAALRVLLANGFCPPSAAGSRDRKKLIRTCPNQCANFPTPKNSRIRCAMPDSAAFALKE